MLNAGVFDLSNKSIVVSNKDILVCGFAKETSFLLFSIP